LKLKIEERKEEFEVQSTQNQWPAPSIQHPVTRKRPWSLFLS